MNSYNRQARWWILVFVTLLCVYLCWLMVRPFVSVLAWATVLVIVFYPVHRRLVERTKRPALSALLSCLLVVLTILIPVVVLTFAVVHEMSGAANNLQWSITYLLDPNSPITGRALRWVGQYVDVEQIRSGQYLAEQLQGVGGQIASRTLGIIGGTLLTMGLPFYVIATGGGGSSYINFWTLFGASNRSNRASSISEPSRGSISRRSAACRPSGSLPDSSRAASSAAGPLVRTTAIAAGGRPLESATIVSPPALLIIPRTAGPGPRRDGSSLHRSS